MASWFGNTMRWTTLVAGVLSLAAVVGCDDDSKSSSSSPKDDVFSCDMVLTVYGNGDSYHSCYEVPMGDQMSQERCVPPNVKSYNIMYEGFGDGCPKNPVQSCRSGDTLFKYYGSGPRERCGVVP